MKVSNPVRTPSERELMINAMPIPHVLARPREARTGDMVNHPHVVEMIAIKNRLRMTSKALVLRINEVLKALPPEQRKDLSGGKAGITYHRLQSYIQGYILGENLNRRMLKLLRTVEQLVLNEGGAPLANRTNSEIISEWIAILGIDPEEHSVYRELAAVANRVEPSVTHTTIFRWMNSKMRPRSIQVLINIDNEVRRLGRNWRPELTSRRRRDNEEPKLSANPIKKRVKYH